MLGYLFTYHPITSALDCLCYCGYGLITEVGNTVHYRALGAGYFPSAIFDLVFTYAEFIGELFICFHTGILPDTCLRFNLHK